MRMSDLLLFAPPIVVAAFVWVFSELVIRSNRRFRAELERKAAD